MNIHFSFILVQIPRTVYLQLNCSYSRILKVIRTACDQFQYDVLFQLSLLHYGTMNTTLLLTLKHMRSRTNTYQLVCLCVCACERVCEWLFSGRLSFPCIKFPTTIYRQGGCQSIKHLSYMSCYRMKQGNKWLRSHVFTRKAAFL